MEAAENAVAASGEGEEEELYEHADYADGWVEHADCLGVLGCQSVSKEERERESIILNGVREGEFIPSPNPLVNLNGRSTSGLSCMSCSG